MDGGGIPKTVLGFFFLGGGCRGRPRTVRGWGRGGAVSRDREVPSGPRRTRAGRRVAAGEVESFSEEEHGRMSLEENHSRKWGDFAPRARGHRQEAPPSLPWGFQDGARKALQGRELDCIGELRGERWRGEKKENMFLTEQT